MPIASAQAGIELIVGLGNPGPRYRETRHNAGFWFVDALARDATTPLKAEARFHGESGRLTREARLLKPTGYMNDSGRAVAALARFYKIAPEQILVAHDELDIPVGAARLKSGGGHGGHNGLRDIIARLGSNGFHRLRLGIGRPRGPGGAVDYVLSAPSEGERAALLGAIGRAGALLPLLLAGDLQAAMNRLHVQAATEDAGESPHKEMDADV